MDTEKLIQLAQRVNDRVKDHPDLQPGLDQLKRLLNAMEKGSGGDSDLAFRVLTAMLMLDITIGQAKAPYDQAAIEAIMGNLPEEPKESFSVAEMALKKREGKQIIDDLKAYELATSIAQNQEAFRKRCDDAKKIDDPDAPGGMSELLGEMPEQNLHSLTMLTSIIFELIERIQELEDRAWNIDPCGCTHNAAGDVNHCLKHGGGGAVREYLKWTDSKLPAGW